MSYNAENMWDGPQPPFSGFRGRAGEPYPPRWPHGFEPRMRGRSPLPFRGGAMPPGPPYVGQGGNPFSYRDPGRGQEGAWEENRPVPQEPMNIPRRGVPPAHFRDMHYAGQGLAPDMDYREKEGMEQRHWTTPDVDYRAEEGPAIGYRVRLPPSASEYRRRMIAEREIQEREAIEMEHRKRLAASLDYRQREAAEIENNLRLEGMLKRREREEMLFREREYTERLLREREALERMRDREVAALSLKNRETASLSFRGREVVEFTERRLPSHVGESADLDLRMTEPDKSMDFLGRDMGSVAVSYRKEDKMVLEYMEVEHQEIEALNTGKDTAGFTPMDKESAEMPYRQGGTSCVKNYDKGESQTQRPEFQKHTDTDYREKECADSDYREKESSDSDYRGRENADLNYRDTKTADSDYREKEPADSDYRERESTDTDYRQNAEDYSKESTDKIDTERDFLASNLEEDKKGLPGEVKSTTDYPLIPTEMEKTGPQEIIPFLAFSEEELSSLTKMIVDTKSKPPAEVPAPSRSDPSCPGKLDIDFRDRSNQEDGNSGTKERAEKPLGYTAHGSTPDELCIGDQDLRSKDCFAKEPNKVEGDQDLRTSGHGQKDEDLRGGETKSNEEFFTQNYLLLDFLRLAAKELRDKTTEADEEHVALTPPIPEPSTAKPFLPDIITRPARPLGTGSTIVPSIDFLCREDTDYRSMDFNDVDLRVGHRPEKRSREESQPGSKDKDYRRTPVPEGATKIIWLDGLPTGASREDILCALGSVHKLPEGVNLIGYIPGYSFGSVCVEFSLVEEAVGFMEANKGVLHFRGKRVTLKYIPNSDRWTCLQCKAVNALSKERCWQCSALRAGTDHLSLRDAHKEPKTPPSTSTQRSKKRKSKHSPSGRSPDRWKEITPPREKSPQPKTSKGAKEADSESATVIIRGIGVNTSPDSVVKVLQPFAQLSPSNVRIMRNRKSNRPRYGLIDLKNHKEAIRLTVLVRDLKEPLTIDGKAISVDLAVDQRKNEQGKSPKGNKSGPSKNRKQRAQKKPFTYPGFKANADEGPSYIYYPKAGCYVDPLTYSFYNEKSDSYSSWDPERDRKETSSHTRRGFKEEKETEEEAFKKPLPPPMVKKEEPAEPKVNPLLGLIGAYAEDSDDEEQDEETLPPLRKKPAPLLPPATTPKPVPKPVPIPMPKPEPKPVPSISDDNKLTDWKKMICLLCRRQFPSKEALIRHQTFSDLHKQNIAIHEKIRKSQKELEYLQQREQEENKCIQRRLQQAKKELEMLEREEEGATQQEAGEGLDIDVHTPEKRKAKGADTRSDPSGEKKRVKAPVNHKPVGESYRENMKQLILARYKLLE